MRNFAIIKEVLYYPMGYTNRNNGCATTLWVICVVPIFLFMLGKGCISCADEIFKSSNSTNNTNFTPNPTISNKDEEWGKNGVDPVLRTSSGGIYKDPNYPDYYFDITMPCHQCNGKGSWETLKANPDIYDSNGNLRTNVPIGRKITVKCSACYGTGYEKQPIPSDEKVPLKPVPQK